MFRPEACNFIKKETVACNFVKKETLAQVFSCEFCEISKNIFFIKYFRETVSEMTMIALLPLVKKVTISESAFRY